MNIHKITWERYDSNSYVLEINNYFIAIDCNCNLISYLTANKITLNYLFITHEHFDHIDGIGKVKNNFPNMQVIASKNSSELFSSDTDNMSFFFEGKKVVEAKADIEIIEDTVFKIADKKIECYLTPGHTEGSMVIHIDNMLFTGDTILNNIKTPKNLPNSSQKKLVESLDFIEEFFEDKTLFYPGHGDKFYKQDWNKLVSLGKK